MSIGDDMHLLVTNPYHRKAYHGEGTLKPTRRSPLPHVPTPPDSGPERRVVDRDQIARAALDTLDDVGLDRLTMRRVAERLDIKAASLYWHVRDKADLLGLMAEAICAVIQIPSPHQPWRERLTGLLRDYRRALLAHRDAAVILADTLPTGPQRLALIEVTLSTLLAAGFTVRDVISASRLVTDYVTEFVIEEQRFASSVVAPEPGASGSPTNIGDFFAQLPQETYPCLTLVAPHRIAADTELRFDFGLEVIFDGLARRLAQGKSC